MQIKPNGSNQTLASANGCTVLYSYETPVVLEHNGNYFKTDKKWSVTTSKHINRFLSGCSFELVPQDHLDNWMSTFGDINA